MGYLRYADYPQPTHPNHPVGPIYPSWIYLIQLGDHFCLEAQEMCLPYSGCLNEGARRRTEASGKVGIGKLFKVGGRVVSQ